MKKEKYEKPIITAIEIEAIKMLAGTQTDHGDAKRRDDFEDEEYLEDEELDEDTGLYTGDNDPFELWKQ